MPILEHLSMSNRSISYVIELCVCALLEKGMHEEGLLRVGCGEWIYLLHREIKTKRRFTDSVSCVDT